MTLPTFLGIGVPRAGSTWLRDLLASHPAIYLPPHRQEIHFFNQHYERGLPWYEKLFPPEVRASRYQAIGEITPQYLYCPLCPERIARLPSITRLILILRNPIDRAYSDYGFQVRDKNYQGSFKDYLAAYPFALQAGFYSQKLRDYLHYFHKNQMLVLIYEQATADVPQTKDSLARFLNISVDQFPLTAGSERVNRSYIPKAQPIYILAARVANYLRQAGWGRVVDLVKRLGLNQQLFDGADPFPPLEEETRKYLAKMYQNEIKTLELLLQIDLDCWKRLFSR